MKALCADEGVASLVVRDLPLPEVKAGEVRVRVHSSALNPADQKVLGGEFLGKALHGQQRPLVTGWDLAGTVEAVGPGADFAVGDEVFGCLAYSRSTQRGAFAEAVVAPAACLARRPQALSPADAAALATAGLTALQTLRDIGRVKAGSRVLIIGAAGGVGAIAVGVARQLGAQVTGVCAASAADWVRSLGATAILPRGELHNAPVGEGYDVVLDAPVGTTFWQVKAMLKPGGVYISTLPGPGILLAKALAPLFGRRAAFIMVKGRRADLELLAEWATHGLRIPIDSTFPVRDLKDALARLARGGMKGRVVISVEGGF